MPIIAAARKRYLFEFRVDLLQQGGFFALEERSDGRSHVQVQRAEEGYARRADRRIGGGQTFLGRFNDRFRLYASNTFRINITSIQVSLYLSI